MKTWFRLTTPKAILSFLALGFLVFSNGFSNNFVGDDIPQIVNNSSLHSLSNVTSFFTGSTFYNGGLQKLSGIYYKPLLMTYFSLIYSIFGPSYQAYHVMQLLIHVGGTTVLYLVFLRFFRQNLAYICGLIFLIHPINSEAVFYISDSQDVMFFFFGISALWILMKAGSKMKLVWMTICLLFSILSKETGGLFLGLIPLYSFIYKKEYFWKSLTGSVCVFVLYCMLRVNALGDLIVKSDPIAPIEKLALWTRITNIPEIAIFYLKTFIFPINLSYSYNWVYKTLTFEHFFMPLGLCLIIVFAAGYGARYLLNKGLTEEFKMYLFFCLWFGAGIFLHSQLIPLDATVADRWFYFSMAGILGLGAVTVKTLNIRFKSMRTQLIIGLVVLMMMGTRTVVRSFDFRNEFTLNSHDVKVSRDDYNLEGGLASNLLNLGRTREALMHAENSIRLNPFWSNYNTLGSIYLSLGEFSKARNAYDKALSFTDYYQVYENIAGMTLLTGEYEENVNLIKSYIERFPQHDKLWLYIAILQYTHGDTIEGKAAIMKAQEFNYSGNPEIKAIYYAIMNNLPLKLNLKVGND